MRFDLPLDEKQPFTLRIKPYWRARGLAMVFAGHQILWSRGQGKLRLAQNGGPKLLPSKFGLVSGFGTTYGSGTTDRLDGGILPRPSTGWRSIVSCYYANGYGGGNLGRIFQDASGTGLQAGEGLYCNNGTINGTILYGLYCSTTFGAWYSSASTLVTGRWQSAGVTHDQRTVNNIPIIYLDGASVAVNIYQNASGTYQTAPCNLVWGNRASDGARGWDGLLGPTLIFDGALTDADHLVLSKDPWSVVDTDPMLLLFGSAAGGTHTLTGANCSQSATSGTGAVTQAHVLTGSATSQSSTSGTGAITQAHVLAGAACSQSETSGTGSVTQAHVLSGANCTQAQTSGTGAVVVGGVHTLNGAATTQAATSGTGAVTQAHVITGAACSQSATSGTGIIYQSHHLIGSACVQTATSTTGSLGAGVVVMASRRSAHITTKAKRPAALSTGRRPWH